MAAYTKAISGNAYKNRGGTVVFGGNATTTTTSPFTNNPALSLTVANKAIGQTIGSQVVASSTLGVQKALSSGNLATMTKGRYVMTWLSGGYLAGVAARSFNTPANYNINNLNSIHKKESIRSRLIVTAGWNYVTGRPLTTPTAQSDSFGNDDAARPSRSIPGEFIIKESNKRAASMKDYSAKTD
jgi:hypothetical protein